MAYIQKSATSQWLSTIADFLEGVGVLVKEPVAVVSELSIPVVIAPKKTSSQSVLISYAVGIVLAMCFKLFSIQLSCYYSRG